MKKTYRMENLDCANCAARMEEAIRKIEGVNGVTISFMTQRITIDAEDAVFENVVEKAAKACNRIDRGCTIKA